MADSKDFKKAHLFRGYVLNECIFIERMIDRIIVNHFTKVEAVANELQELIVSDRMTFENKARVLQYLLETYHKEFVANHKKLNADIKEVITERNIFAHNILNTSEIGERKLSEGIYGFLKLKNTIDTIWYTPEKVEKLFALLRSTKDCLFKLDVHS